MSPTARQQAALRFIAGYQEAHDGVSPTLTAMMAGIGERSKGNMHRFLTALERRRTIRRAKHKQQWIEVLTPVSIPRSPEGEPLYFVGLHNARRAG